MLDSMKSVRVIMSSCTSFFIIFILPLSFSEKFINSEPFVPQPAIVFSGHNDQQNHISAFDMNETSHLATNNSIFPLSFQKSPSPSYRSPEELTNNFYNVPKIANMNELLSDESIFRFFRDDNFGENYRRINETYFSQGIDLEEKRPQKPIIQNSLTTELPHTIAVNKISVQSPSSSLKTFVKETRKVLNDSISQKKDSKIATAPSLALKHWEMQRTDSGQSIIKVTTVSAPIQITGRDELYHVSATENGNINDDDNSGSNDLSSNNNRRREFTNLKENLSFPSATNQPAISVSNILTKNIPILEDNLLATTATIETTFTTYPKLLSTILTPYQNQKTQSTTAKINLAKDITNFGAIKTTSAKSLTIMETTDAQNLTLSRTSLFPEPDHSLFSVLNLKASGLPPSPPSPLLFSLSSTFDDNDDLTKSSANNTLPSNNNEGKIESKLKNGSFELSSILGNQIDGAFSNLIHLEKQQMGISMPKYKNSLTGIIFSQIPKQNGVNTVVIDTGSTTNTGVSIKREITKGKILEEQKSFINGKPVTLQLWNPIIYGHDWLANPGAIIHGSIQPLQAEIYSVKSETERRKGRHKHTQMFAERSISNDTGMNQKSKQKKKPRKDKNMAMEQMYRKEKLAEACRGDSKDFNDSNDQESNVLVIYTEKGNSSVENELQGTGKYQHPQQCFYVMNNCALSATAPFERRIGISLIECAQFCSSLLGCLSASYSIRFAICDTYHFKFDLRGKKVMKTAWHYYLEPQTSDTSECSMENSSKQITVSKKIGGEKKSIKMKRIGSEKKSIKMKRFLKREVDRIGTNLNISSVHYDILLNYSKTGQQYDCPIGENIVMTKAPGWRISKFNGRRRKYFTTEIECLQSCYANRYKNSTAYHCSSAIFDENSNRCSLYSVIYPANNTLIRDASTIYYEKHCFSEQIAKLCNGALIERQPQHILLTFPDAILTTSTLMKCLLKCLWSLQDGRTFQCHSLIYFYEQKDDNCILNSRSKRSNPNSLREERISVVDYFDLDECLNIPIMDQVSKTNSIRINQYKTYKNILMPRRTHVKW